MAGRVRLGELLVEAQIITRQQLEEVLALQRTDGRRLGTLLVEGGLVTETQVTQLLSQQLSVPWVSLYHIDFSRQLLNLVPRDLAERFCLVPIFVRRVRGMGDTLYIAMDDPSDEPAQREISQYAGLPVRTMIAPPSDIRAAIRAYYGGSQQPSAVPAAPSVPPGLVTAVVPLPSASAEPVKPAAKPSGPPAPASVAAEPVTEPDTESSPRIEAREVSMPAPRRGSVPRMITVTLLDGTQVNLPAKQRSERPSPDDEQLTAGDLVAALRAAAHGAETDGILGDNARWEKLFAALLTVLMKKHLLADWEFIEELKRV
jgi:type IV pilus assembly protein PilB